MENDINVLSSHGSKLPNTNEKKAALLIKNNNAVWINSRTIQLKNRVFDKRYKKFIVKDERRVCYICLKKIPKDEFATVDHVISISDGGSNSRENLRCCCKRCNSDKNRLSLDKYLKKIDSKRHLYKYISDKQLIDLKFYSKKVVSEFLKENIETKKT